MPQSHKGQPLSLFQSQEEQPVSARRHVRMAKEIFKEMEASSSDNGDDSRDSVVRSHHDHRRHPKNRQGRRVLLGGGKQRHEGSKYYQAVQRGYSASASANDSDDSGVGFKRLKICLTPSIGDHADAYTMTTGAHTHGSTPSFTHTLTNSNTLGSSPNANSARERIVNRHEIFQLELERRFGIIYDAVVSNKYTTRLGQHLLQVSAMIVTLMYKERQDAEQAHTVSRLHHYRLPSTWQQHTWITASITYGIAAIVFATILLGLGQLFQYDAAVHTLAALAAWSQELVAVITSGQQPLAVAGVTAAGVITTGTALALYHTQRITDKLSHKLNLPAIPLPDVQSSASILSPDPHSTSTPSPCSTVRAGAL